MMTMRIGYLINQYPKVSHSFIRREIEALERLGLEVTRIALRGWDAELVDDADVRERASTRYILNAGKIEFFGAAAHALLTRPLSLARAFAAAWRLGRRGDRPRLVHLIYLAEACVLARWLRAAKVPHLHAHFGTNSAEIAMLAHMLGGPRFSFTVHGPEEFDKAGSIGLSEKLSRAAFAVAISSFGRSQLMRWLDHRQWSKLHVVHCGLEPASFEGDDDSGARSNRLVCVGRLCEQKGQLLLIEAVKRLIDRGTDVELVLAGDGEMRPAIEALIERNKLRSRIRITGWISNARVKAEILAARALVLPSFAEGLPVVLMEAMALQRPVISTYVAGIPELVEPGKQGWLVPAGDIDALVAAMQACLAAPASDLIALGVSGRARALARHDIDCEALKLAALFGFSPSREAAAARHADTVTVRGAREPAFFAPGLDR